MMTTLFWIGVGVFGLFEIVNFVRPLNWEKYRPGLDVFYWLWIIVSGILFSGLWAWSFVAWIYLPHFLRGKGTQWSDYPDLRRIDAVVSIVFILLIANMAIRNVGSISN